MRAPRGDAGGFTFVEVLFAAAILAITSLGMVASMAQGSRINAGAREEQVAWNALYATRAEIATSGIHSIASTWDQTGFDESSLKPVAGDADGLPGLASVTYVADGPTFLYYEVTLEVSWAGVRGDRSILNTFRVANLAGSTDPLP